MLQITWYILLSFIDKVIKVQVRRICGSTINFCAIVADLFPTIYDVLIGFPVTFVKWRIVHIIPLRPLTCYNTWCCRRHSRSGRSRLCGCSCRWFRRGSSFRWWCCDFCGCCWWFSCVSIYISRCCWPCGWWFSWNGGCSWRGSQCSVAKRCCCCWWWCGSYMAGLIYKYYSFVDADCIVACS